MTRTWLTAALLALLLACCSPYLLPSLVLETAGIVVPGTVTAKQESFRMLGGDRVRHSLEVSYRFTPVGSAAEETSAHQVDAALYDRLQIGSPAAIRYNPWPFVRSLHMVAVGSVLAESPWASRIPGYTDTIRTSADIALLLLTVLLAVIAWRRQTRGWILAAVFCAATAGSAVVPCGFVAFPLLFAKWWKSRGEGYGWVLLASMLLMAPILYWRVPQPAPEPAGDVRTAVAKVVHVSLVDHVWSGHEDSGQSIPLPFQMADLEFTPQGASGPVHALDRVDADSVNGLSDGRTVRVSYSAADPRAARIEGGTRTYAARAANYLLGMTFGVAAVLMLVVLPVVALIGWMSGRVRRALPSMSREAVAQRLAHLAPDDPRRKTLDGLLRRPSDF